MMSIRKNLICFSLVLAMASIANATLTLTLSTHANDDKGNVSSPDLFDATLDFSVVGSTLTLDVTNLTPENVDDPVLKINEVYFNATENITDLILTSVIDPVKGQVYNQWESSDFLEDGFLVGGFGRFDMKLVDGVGGAPHVIDSGETLTFVFDIAWTGTEPSAINFTTEFSTVGGGHIESYAAAKFYDGDQPGISGYGATDIPEPVTLMLLGLGGLALLRRKH